MAVVLILLFFLMLNLLGNAGEISKVFAVPIPVSLHLKPCLPMFGSMQRRYQCYFDSRDAHDFPALAKETYYCIGIYHVPTSVARLYRYGNSLMLRGKERRNYLGRIELDILP